MILHEFFRKILYSTTLPYWYKKLKGKPIRNKFLLMKTVEILIQAYYTKKQTLTYNVADFLDNKLYMMSVNPKIALIVPVLIKNNLEKNNLEKLLASIDNLIRKPNIVIIIDDGSPIKFTCPKEYTLLRKDRNEGPATARNLGKKLALKMGADIIAFTDADCILDKFWTKKIIDFYSKNNQFNILSGNTIAKDKHWLGNYHNITGTINGRMFKNSDRLLFGPTCNLAITKEVAKQINFNVNFKSAAGEDVEFCFRANKLGYMIGHIPDMTVYHNYGYGKNFYKNLKIFISRQMRYMGGFSQLRKEIPEYFIYQRQTKEISATPY